MVSLKIKYVCCLLLPVYLLIYPTVDVFAQNAPVITAATVGGAIAGPVDVPLTVTGFTGIGAVSLSIDYDYSVLHFTGGTPNPLMPSFPVGDMDLETGYHRITMGWYGSGATLSDGSTLMTLHFTYISGISSLAWYDSGPSCEFTDAQYNVLNDAPTDEYYINGNVCGVIGTPTSVYGSSAVCQGQTGEEYLVGPVMNATGYVWTLPEGAFIITGLNTNAITVDFSDTAVSGNISVYGTNDCSSGPVSELAVTVNELPDADAGEDMSIPYGTSTYLNAGPGGYGVYGVFLYHWSPEELLVDPDVEDPQTVILTSTTIFTVTLTNMESDCQSSDEVTVTITGGPLSVNPVAIPTSICQGESSQLFSNAGGGSGNYAYQWSSDPPGSPPWSSTLANPIVSPDSSRHYTLVVYDGYTTTSGSSNLSVNSLPSATISGGDTLCGENVYTNLQVDLTGNPPWSFTYSYGSTSVFITEQPVSPFLIIATDPGDYTITAVEDINCAGSSYGTAVVRKYPVPATPEIMLYGNEMVSSSCCGNQWYMNDAAIPGETGQTCEAAENGRYFVIVTLNTCSSSPSEVVDMIVGIRENTAGAYNFYPNPANDFINIQSTQNVKGMLNISLCSANGIVIKEFVFEEEGGLFTLDIRELSEGLYFLMISGDEVRAVGKLIVR
jgi:hypothetical protein